jgi:hypothetical protein
MNSLDNVIDYTYADPTDARLILQSAQPGQCLYQLPLKVPSAWYDQFNIGRKYKIRNFVPDFIFVNGTGPHRTLRIIDAKAAKRISVSHQASHLIKSIGEGSFFVYKLANGSKLLRYLNTIVSSSFVRLLSEVHYS